MKRGIAAALAVAALFPAAASAAALDLDGVPAAESACTAQPVEPFGTGYGADPANPGRTVICRRLAVPSGDSTSGSVECEESVAEFRGEWTFSSNGWLTLEASEYGQAWIHNWGASAANADLLVGCYDRAPAAAAASWTGLDWIEFAPAARRVVHRPRGAKAIAGTAAADQARAGAGNDRISGARGDDLLLGQGGNDVLSGGPGNDALFDNQGRDTLNGGPGDDRFSAVDRTPDKIVCGPGRDTVVADPKDAVRGCERVRWLQP